MYNITRLEAAETLNISTRSLDRYIKSGKIRSKKEGKIVYVNSEDIKILSGVNNINHNVIMPNKESKSNDIIKEHDNSKGIFRKNDFDQITASFEKIFTGLREEIGKKDETIQELSMRLGKAEEISKNSISLIEHKKSQFLIEESKIHLNQEINEMKNKNNKLEEELKYEKMTTRLITAFLILLLISAVVIWFVKI